MNIMTALRYSSLKLNLKHSMIVHHLGLSNALKKNGENGNLNIVEGPTVEELDVNDWFGEILNWRRLNNDDVGHVEV